MLLEPTAAGSCSQRVQGGRGGGKERKEQHPHEQYAPGKCTVKLTLYGSDFFQSLKVNLSLSSFLLVGAPQTELFWGSERLFEENIRAVGLVS